MSYNIECPYCGECCGVPDENPDEGEENEEQCAKCKKYFMYTTSYSANYSSHKAPCLNGGKHKWRKMVGAPREFFKGKFECRYCNEEKTVKKTWRCGYCKNEYISKKEADECPNCHKDDKKTKEEIKKL